MEDKHYMYRAGNCVAGMEQSLAAKILDRQRADTIEAMSHSAEWSASVAMVLQQFVDPSTEIDRGRFFRRGRGRG